MNKVAITLLVITLTISGCATSSSPPSSSATFAIAVSPEVRASSGTDEVLFRDLIAKPGGVGFTDFMLNPNIAKRELAKIEVVSPFNTKTGAIERWHINHDGQPGHTYLVKLIPDATGGTKISVEREDNN